MFNPEQEMRKLLEKHPDPRQGAYGRLVFSMREATITRFTLNGIVVDNKDPAKLGRVRVQYQPGGGVSGWIPPLHLFIGDKYGIWNVPDIGAVAVLLFPPGCPGQAAIDSYIYTEDQRPPKHSTKNPADSMVLQTKAFRIEIVDEEGNEGIYIQTRDGKMRISMNAQGIQAVNEVGDIHIKARKLALKGENVRFSAKKEIKLESKGTMKIHSTKQTVFERG